MNGTISAGAQRIFDKADDVLSRFPELDESCRPLLRTLIAGAIAQHGYDVLSGVHTEAVKLSEATHPTDKGEKK